MLFCGSCLCYQNGKGNTDGEKTGKRGRQHPQTRKDGRWEGALHGGHRSGDGEANRKERPRADAARMQREAAKGDGGTRKIDITKRRDYTVGEWAQLWYENYAKPSVRASTAAYYKNYIDQHIVPRIGDVKLTALTTLQIQKFYNETKAHGRVQRYEKNGRSESQQQDDSRTAHDAAAVLGAGGDGAADSVQSRKRLPPAEEGKRRKCRSSRRRRFGIT